MKDNLILHHDTLSVIKELSDEQAGQLIKEIFDYSVFINNPKEAKEPSGLSGLLNSVAHPFKMQLDRDLIKYSNVVERNAKNGQKGGRPKKEETQKKPLKPKKADSVSDSDKESDSDTIKKEIVIKAFTFSLSASRLLSSTSKEYQSKLQEYINNSGKQMSYEDFYTQCEMKPYKYKNFKMAYDTWNKNAGARPTKTDNNINVAKSWLEENDTQDVKVIGSK